jgi:hypothetical protein
MTIHTAFNWVKNFGSDIYHSKVVQSSLEKASFAGGFAKMHISQFCFGKKELALPRVIQNNVVHGTHQGLDRLIGIATSETLNKAVSPLLEIVDPIARGFSHDKQAANELVTKYSIPVEILQDRFTDFRTFLLNSKIYMPAQFYNHPIIFDQQLQDFMVLIDGHHVRAQDILRDFKLENRVPTERMFLPAILVHRASNERYYYLGNGLTRHDVEQDIRPYKTLPPDERPHQSVVKFKFRIDDKLESPEDAANFVYHAWCELEQPSGACYSFGVYGKGVAQCPDPALYGDPKGIRSIDFPVTPETALEVFKTVQDHRDNMEWKYHLTKANCASFVTEIGKTIHVDISEKDKINLYDGLITRVTVYAISSMLAAQLREPDVISKIGSVQELANLTDTVDRLPSLLQNPLTNFSLEEALKSVPLANLLQHHPLIKSVIVQAFAMLQNPSSSANTARFSDFTPFDLPLSAEELREFTRSLLTGSTTELTYKIYNLLERIIANYYDYPVHSPRFTHDRAVQEKQKQKSMFSPMGIL